MQVILQKDVPKLGSLGDLVDVSDGYGRNYLIPRGFAVVHSASPGTGLSQGCPTVGGDNESLAPKAVIDWLNGRAKGYTEGDGTEEVKATWCTGKVGMTGTSYNGTLPLAAASSRQNKRKREESPSEPAPPGSPSAKRAPPRERGCKKPRARRGQGFVVKLINFCTF